MLYHVAAARPRANHSADQVSNKWPEVGAVNTRIARVNLPPMTACRQAMCPP